jgi:hypothetical protein
MPVEICDLHWPRTCDDHFRLASLGGHSMEAVVGGNISAAALGLWLEEIQSLLRKYQVKDLQLVFNCDGLNEWQGRTWAYAPLRDPGWTWVGKPGWGSVFPSCTALRHTTYASNFSMLFLFYIKDLIFY